MNGWIKLWRKSLDNRIFFKDRTSWFVFEYLLLTVDKETGKRTFGRFQLADVLGIKPATLYSALKRLQSAKMVNINSNNKFSEISICNWVKYQDTKDNNVDTSDNNKSTTNQQQINTKQELRIKNEELNTYNTETENSAKLLINLVKKNYPFLKKETPAKGDYEAIDKLNRLDGYGYEIINAVITWSQNDPFWKQNIRSGAKLREKFESLLVRINGKYNERGKNYDQ